MKLDIIGFILYTIDKVLDGRDTMPVIARFHGIVIKMYLRQKEHNPPHIHAFYGEFEASFTIQSGDIINGSFPKNGKRLVKQFVNRYKNELLEMWNTGIYQKLPPLS